MTTAKQIAASIKELAETGALLIGVGLMSYGAWLYSQPAGYITAGALIVAGVLLRARGG